MWLHSSRVLTSNRGQRIEQLFVMQRKLIRIDMKPIRELGENYNSSVTCV